MNLVRGASRGNCGAPRGHGLASAARRRRQSDLVSIPVCECVLMFVGRPSPARTVGDVAASTCVPSGQLTSAAATVRHLAVPRWAGTACRMPTYRVALPFRCVACCRWLQSCTAPRPPKLMAVDWVGAPRVSRVMPLKLPTNARYTLFSSEGMRGSTRVRQEPAQFASPSPMPTFHPHISPETCSALSKHTNTQSRIAR